MRSVLICNVKALVRDLLAATIHRSGLSNVTRVPPDTLLILTFHRVLPTELRDQYPLPGLAVTPEELRWVLSRLCSHFEVLPVSEAWSALPRAASHTRPLLSVTFDDGQWDNLAFADPVLRAAGVRATFYVPVDAIEAGELLWHDVVAFSWASGELSPARREAWLVASGLQHVGANASAGMLLEAMKRLDPDSRDRAVRALRAETRELIPSWARMMTWQELGELARRGHEVGSHGMSHRLLSQLSVGEQRIELSRSRQLIAARAGVAVQSVCYPNGDFDEQTVRLAADAGYSCGVTTQWGLNRRETPPFALKRCDMDARRLLDRRGNLSEARLRMRLFVRWAVR